MTAFLGVIDWRNQDAPDRAAPNIVPTAYYQRFTIAQIQAGALVAWLKTVPIGKSIGIRIQELVPGSSSLPNNHNIPGSYDSGFSAFVPDYNSDEWFSLIRSTLQTVATQINGYLIGRIDISFGKWGEAHLYRLLVALSRLRPTDESLQKLFLIYKEVFGIDHLYAPIGNKVLLKSSYNAGGRRVFCDSWGLITDDYKDRAELFYNDLEVAEILNSPNVQITGETGSSDPKKLNFNWIVQSFERHKNVVSFANGNIPFGALPAESKRLFIRSLEIVANRRLEILQPLPPTLPPTPIDNIAVLQAQILVLQTELATTKLNLVQCNVDKTNALNRISTLKVAAQKVIVANVNNQQVFTELNALTQ